MILLSDFSSYLEIVAGIYTSMCLNDVLKGIWNTKYYTNLTSALEQFKIQEHEGVINKIIENNKKVAEGIKWFMQRRAALMLTVDIILLLLCGFECRFASENNAKLYLRFVQFYMIIISALAFISLIFNKFLFSNNRMTAFVIIVILLISSIFLILNILYDIIWFPDYYIFAILVFLSVPILWQLFACWVYSNAYAGYIKKKIGKVKSQYDAVRSGIESKNITLVPTEYMQLFTQKSLNQSGASLSQCLGDYLDILEERLIADSRPSSAITIFVSWIKFKISIVKDSILILFKKKGRIKKRQIVEDVPTKEEEFKTIDPKNLDYSKQLLEYQDEKRAFKKVHPGKPPSMKVFCEKHGYNYEEMIAWVRFINKSNNRRNEE